MKIRIRNKWKIMGRYDHGFTIQRITVQNKDRRNVRYIKYIPYPEGCKLCVHCDGSCGC